MGRAPKSGGKTHRNPGGQGGRGQFSWKQTAGGGAGALRRLGRKGLGSCQAEFWGWKGPGRPLWELPPGLRVRAGSTVPAAPL